MVVWALAILLAACGPATPSPSRSVELGTVAIRVARVAGEDGFFASEHHARLTAPDGTLVREWRLGANAVASVDVPAGSYALDTFTVFLSDFVECTADPAASGGQRCLQPTLGPAMFCSAPITVEARGRIEAVFSILPDGACRLGLPPAPTPSAT